MKNCTPLWSEAHLQVKMYKTLQLRSTFGSCDVEKVHAVVARSTFRSQNVQSTPAPDHFAQSFFPLNTKRPRGILRRDAAQSDHAASCQTDAAKVATYHLANQKFQKVAMWHRREKVATWHLAK